jgi:hypothetical protein
MKIIPAFMTWSLRRGAGALRAQLAAVYAPPPDYYGDYGAPPRYVLAVARAADRRDTRRVRTRHDPRRVYDY